MKVGAWVAVALVAVFAACGSSDESSDEDQAKEAALAFFEAEANADGQAMCDLMSEDFQDAASSQGVECAEGAVLMASPIELPEVTNASISGDSGSVEVTVSGKGTYVADMLKEDGEWKVDSVTHTGQ